MIGEIISGLYSAIFIAIIGDFALPLRKLDGQIIVP